MLHVGTCGFPVARKKYSQEFKVVEIQKTFYTPIKEETAKIWREEMPRDFEFTMKAPQTITHLPNSPTYRRYKGKNGDFGFFKNNEDVMSSWEQARKIGKILRAKIIIFQSPASFKEDKNNIKNIYDFFNSIERDFIFGWEPRGKWGEASIKKICSDLNLIHVVDPFKNKKLWGDFGYYRLHGIGGYKYIYSRSDLEFLIKIVRDGDYVMFNNTNMWEDAKKFKLLLSEKQLHNVHYQ